MDAKKTGAYLADLRRARGLTQQEAADQLGVSNKTVSKWENGAGLPDITVLPALAELYGVTVISGSPAPFSHLLTVLLETPSCSAASCWVMPRAFRSAAR